MLTREEIEKIDRECAEQQTKRKDYLLSHQIDPVEYYRWRKRYKNEDEQSLVPAGFVPLAENNDTSKHRSLSKRKKVKEVMEDVSFLTIEIRTAAGSEMRIKGDLTSAQLREIITASNVQP